MTLDARMGLVGHTGEGAGERVGVGGDFQLRPGAEVIICRLMPPLVARERVSQNQQFRLDDLAPGRYVILAQYAGGNVSTSLEVSVAPGQVAEVDLPNTCK
jgi:hypothetical protein